MSDFKDINPFQLDSLKEIGNIGAGNATTSLSKLLNKTIEMKVPSVEVVPLTDILDIYEKYETEVAATFFRLEGDVTGHFIITFPNDQADELIKDMIQDTGLDQHYQLASDVGSSIFKEIGNILAGTYLSALSDFTQLKISLTPPDLIVDMTSTIISEGLLEMAAYVDHAIIVETTLFEYRNAIKTQLNGHFFLLPNPESLEKVFHELGV